MFETILLTGASGAGKSTLARTFARENGYAVFDYGAELTRHASAEVPGLTQEQVRSGSRRLVLGHHVTETDKALQDFVDLHRPYGHVIVDSHAVTKEDYGFRSVDEPNGQNLTPRRVMGEAIGQTE
jgi:adenylate kinase